MTARSKPALGTAGKPRKPLAQASTSLNSSADAGRGSDTFALQGGWRAALLGTVAAGGLLLSYGRSARAQVIPPDANCTADGAVITCSGDVSTGVKITSPLADNYTTLDITNPASTSITPAPGVDGIAFRQDPEPEAPTSGLTVNVGTASRPLSITTTTRVEYRTDYDGNSYVYNTFDGDGINAFSRSGDVLVNSFATITSSGIGIFAGSDAVSTSAGEGVYDTVAGDVTVNSTGAINSGQTGIRALSQGALSITSTGDITSGFDGIEASATNDVAVTSVGNVTSQDDIGIEASSRRGNVSVTSTGDVTTFNEVAIYASSGGTVNLVSRGTLTASGSGEMSGIEARGSRSVFDDGEVQSDSLGDVVVSNTGNITVSGGFRGYGIFGQSNGGNITIVNDGDITASVDDSFGIKVRAFSTYVKNGPYSYAYDDDSQRIAISGDVNITSNGNITSVNGPAVYAFAVSGSDVTVALESGVVQGQTGVEFKGGKTNTLTNRASLSGANWAILGDTGDETVDNYNLVTGNVDLVAGNVELGNVISVEVDTPPSDINAFNNHIGATFASGAIANLGEGNTLTNAGNLSPGGAGTVLTTVLTGNLVQTASGTFTVDVDEGGAQEADLLQVSGTASFAGSVAPNIVNLTSRSGEVLIATGSSIANDGAAAVDTGIIDFSLDYRQENPEPAGEVLFAVPTPNALYLTWTVDFTSAQLAFTPNQNAVAGNLETIFNVGIPGELTGLYEGLFGLTGDAYLAALDRLHPEHYLAQVEDTLQSSLFFLNSVMSCPTASGSQAFVAEDQCYWAKIGGRSFDWDRTQFNIGGDAESWNVSGGVQVALHDNWRLGAALSYERSWVDTHNQASSDGDRVEGALLLKNRWENFTLAAAAFGGYASFDTDRSIGLAGIDAAHGDQDIGFGGVHARLGYTVNMGDWYIRPMIDLNATYLDFGGFTETGAGGAGLSVQGDDEWVLGVSPAIEVGAEVDIDAATIARPFVRIGGTFFNDNAFALSSSFLGAPAAAGPFTVTSQFDDAYLDLSAGIDVLTLDGLEIKLNYESRFSDDSEQHGGGVKVGVKF
jgi:hypothetical protein